LLDVEYLRDCYQSLNRNRAVGIDNISWQEYGAKLDENLAQLVSRLKRKKYKPIPARRGWYLVFSIWYLVFGISRAEGTAKFSHR
jgi:hypothetical protein